MQEREARADAWEHMLEAVQTIYDNRLDGKSQDALSVSETVADSINAGVNVVTTSAVLIAELIKNKKKR